MDIKCQILIAEKVDFNLNTKQHTIFNVLNKVLVPTFPSVIITDVYFKYYFKEHLVLNDYLCEIKILDPTGEVTYEAVLPELMNYRELEMIPGIDGVVEIRLPVYEKGNYEYSIFINNEKICSYPLFIDKAVKL